MSCYPLDQTSIYIHPPYIRLTISISIKTSLVITVLWSKTLISYCESPDTDPPGPLCSSIPTPFPMRESPPPRSVCHPSAAILPCSLQLKARPLLELDLPAVCTGLLEVPIHTLSSERTCKHKKGKAFGCPQSLPVGPPALCFAGAGWVSVGVMWWHRVGRVEVLLHVALCCPSRPSVYFADDELILLAGEQRNGISS